MSIISRTADLYYTFRFLKILVTPWEKMDAFKHGIVDGEGNILKKASELKTSEEKSSYTMFHRLVFNIKKLLNKLPLGRTRIASYAAALYLIKEETGMSEKGLQKIFERLDDVEVDMVLNENTWFLTKNGELQPGRYTLRCDTALIHTAEFLAHKGSKIKVTEAIVPSGKFLGTPIFKVVHESTNQHIYISTEDITR
jgi:hypothetical protein